MKVPEMFYERACQSPESFKTAIRVAKENERERVVESVKGAYNALVRIIEIESNLSVELSQQGKVYSPEVRQWAKVGQSYLFDLINENETSI